MNNGFGQISMPGSPFNPNPFASKKTTVTLGGVEYVVQGAPVMCSECEGNTVVKLKATSNSEIGNQQRIVDTDTTPDSFDGDFGTCKCSGCPCKMNLAPKWLNINMQFITGSDKPCVTMDSFAVCFTGPGIIVPIDPNQDMSNFDFQAYLQAF